MAPSSLFLNIFEYYSIKSTGMVSAFSFRLFTPSPPLIFINKSQFFLYIYAIFYYISQYDPVFSIFNAGIVAFRKIYDKMYSVIECVFQKTLIKIALMCVPCRGWIEE